MANPHKGEVSFEADGKTYTLSLSVNALCELDEAFGVEDAVNALMVAGKMTVKHYRTMFFLALKHHHPEIADEKQAANLVGFQQMIALLSRAAVLAFPAAEEGEANPPQPDQVAGTGPDSGSHGSV